MAEPTLLSAIIGALAEKKSTRKHAITPRYQASNIQTVGHEFEMLIDNMCRSSINRADNNKSVGEKMPIESICKIIKNHPLLACFAKAGDDVPWKWSAIKVESRDDWNSLLPEKDKDNPPKNHWDKDKVELFIRLILEREFFLYANAYDFLTGEKSGSFDHRGCI